MTTRQVRIEKKRSKRGKRLAKKQAYTRVLETAQLFPKVVYTNEGASPEFFDAVQQAMQEIVRNHPRLLGKHMTRVSLNGVSGVRDGQHLNTCPLWGQDTRMQMR
jgi:hypothetical protein